MWNLMQGWIACRWLELHEPHSHGTLALCRLPRVQGKWGGCPVSACLAESCLVTRLGKVTVSKPIQHMLPCLESVGIDLLHPRAWSTTLHSCFCLHVPQVQLPAVGAAIAAGRLVPADTPPVGSGAGGTVMPAGAAPAPWVNPFAAAQATRRASNASTGRGSVAAGSVGAGSVAAASGGAGRSRVSSTTSVRSNAEAEAAAKVRPVRQHQTQTYNSQYLSGF